MMRKVIACLVAVAIFLFPLQVNAEALQGRVTSLAVDEEAPYAGVLLDSVAASKMIVDQKYLRIEIELQLRKEFQKELADKRMAYDLLKVDHDSLKLLSDFENYMDDDLNTSGALSILFELSQPIRKCLNLLKEKDLSEIEKDYLNETFNKWKILSELAGVLGLKVNLNQKKSKNKTGLDTNKIEELIKNRSLAKANKDFLLADKIRTDLRNIGIELIDKPNGLTEWKQL